MILKSGYGLLHKKTNSLLGVRTEHTDADCSVGEIHILEYGIDPVWIAETKLDASYVRKFSTEWYNAGYNTPSHGYKSDELDVVSIELNVEVMNPSYVPTFEEYIKLKYNSDGSRYYDPKHCEFVLSEIKRGANYANYSLYDLRLLAGDKCGDLNEA